MPSIDSIARIDAYSARRLWTEERHLASGRTVIASSPADPSHRFNVIATRRLGGGCVILVHDHLHAAIARLEGALADESFNEAFLRDAYADRTIELGIAAAQAYADASDLHDPPATVAQVRTIDSIDDPALTALRDACDRADWMEGSMDEASPPIFATSVDDSIAGAAHAVAAGDIRKIGVLTHPAHRGRGHARNAAYGLARHFTAEGAVMEWQARLSNTASLAVRDALGFVERYRSIVLRVV